MYFPRPAIALLAMCANFAHANIQTIEPDDFSANQAIVHAGVTLVEFDSTFSSTNAVLSAELGAQYASTGTRVFGNGYFPGHTFTALFDSPIAYFSVDIVNDDGGNDSDTAGLLAYDKDGNSLGFSGWVTVPANPWPGFRSVSISGSGIARVELTSFEIVLIDRIRFSALPVVAVSTPPILALMMPILFGVFALKHRRPLDHESHA